MQIVCELLTNGAARRMLPKAIYFRLPLRPNNWVEPKIQKTFFRLKKKIREK